jgi:putative ABC transport system substrate-binding protein
MKNGIKPRMVGLWLASFSLMIMIVHVNAAEQKRDFPKIGILRPTASSDLFTEAFKHALRQLGYIEGQNIAIEQRFADGFGDRLRDLAAELVRLKVDVIVVSSTPATKAVRAVTKTVPIIFVAVSDPVASGIVPSLARPGGNVTGLTTEPTPELSGKRIELLKQVAPRASAVAVLRNPTNAGTAMVAKETQQAAEKLGLQVHFLDVRNQKDIENAFDTVPGTGAKALSVLVEPLFIIHKQRIVGLAAKSRLPAIYPWKEFVEAGGLMSYGVNLDDLARRAATYVDKILKGTKPADLPVEQPTKFELVINLKTAKQIGLTIPPNLLARADRVIR